MVTSLAKESGVQFQGLSQDEAALRLKSEGLNELPTAKPRSFLMTAVEVLREPMILLLLCGGIIYFFLGDLRDAIVLFGSIFVVIGIELYQERKTERALEALRDLSSPRAVVIRGGQQIRIAGREVVRGDIVIVSEGDRVPADGVVLSATNLLVDESLLTGESVPVRKHPSGDSGSEAMRPGGDDLPFVFSGTMVVQGQGYAEIMATGTATELGKIGKALRSIDSQATNLQLEVSRLARVLAIAGLSLCAIIVVVYSLTRHDWINGLLSGITTAMSLLPEEFPVVLTIFLALGAWRISQKRVLTRHGSAIETLGSATVLCVDKTGTLTQNRMRVQRLFAAGQFLDIDSDATSLPEEFHALLEYSILASKRNPLDPMEVAFQQFGARSLSGTGHLHQDWALIHEYPISPALLSMARVWKSDDHADLVIAAKGAPEAVSSLCRLSAGEMNEIRIAAAQMAADGLRILGVAACSWNAELPHNQQELPFKFVGLVGLSDPIRPEVPAAVEECHRAGIRVAMITGDYAGTAQCIAKQVGITPHENVITGIDLDKMTDAELQQRLRDTNVFARVVPEQKLRLVNAFKANGEIVAMTGDGVNDAPALKAAQIGIAMGARGTDVAREAADLVLLDDSFSSIVQAIRLGRRIFDNLRKAMSFVLAVHVPIAGLSLIPVLAGWPLILMPVHIVFLELIIDPACSIAFEAEPDEPGLMQRPPRDPREPILSGNRILLSCLQGVSVLLVAILLFGIALHRGEAEPDARTLTFATLVIGDIMLILTNRSWNHLIVSTLRTRNRSMWWILGAAFGVLVVVVFVPFFQALFRFGTLHQFDILICLAGGVVSLLWFEGWKMLRNGIRARPE